MSGKTCSTCGQWKPYSEFYRGAGYRDGYKGQCKPCFSAAGAEWKRRNPEKVKEYDRRTVERAKARDPLYHRRKNLRKCFGLTPEQVDEMLAAQGSVCAICGTDAPAGKGWHVDHCHATGRVRGILCHHCNLALGNMQDDPERLLRAAYYLATVE